MNSSVGAAKEGVVDPGEVIVVNIPRELRGRSEIVVYLSEQPVHGESTQPSGRGSVKHTASSNYSTRVARPFHLTCVWNGRGGLAGKTTCILDIVYRQA